MRAFFGALLAGALALASPAQAQAPVNVSVDATSTGSPLDRVWPFYGFDEINYTTSLEGRSLLRTLVGANSAAVHVRNHFLFNTGDGTPALKWGSTNVYTEDAVGNPVYSWDLTDGIMDSVTEAGAFPFIELGFMPQALSTHPTPYANSSSSKLDGGSYYPPTDYVKWGSLVRTWAMHANDRYPTVKRWLWELWNEPDLGYWNGTLDEYTKLYDYTESALHEVIPDAPLGGPAVAGAGGVFLRRFLEHCATGTNQRTGEQGTRLDLVSFHAKGGVAISDDHIQMDLGSQLRIHRAGFNSVAAFSQFKHTPIYVTEADPDGCAACPTQDVPANAYRTSPAYGAYEIAMMKHTLELEAQIGIKLGGLVTWAFTFPDTPYFAGYRNLTSNGISLPVLSALELLGRLDGTRLPLTSTAQRSLDDILANGVRGEPEIDGIATANDGTIQILVWNYHDDIVAVPATPVRLAVQLATSFGARAHVSHLRVDESHGDAYSVWVAQGKPASPNTAQIASLRGAMEPSLLGPDQIVAVDADRRLSLDFELPRFGVSLVTILPTNDAATTDPGDGMQTGSSGVRNDSGCACQSSGPIMGATNSRWLIDISGVALLSAVLRRRRRLRNGARCATEPLPSVDAMLSGLVACPPTRRGSIRDTRATGHELLASAPTYLA